MDYSNLALINMMQTRMMYLGDRQNLLSQNIANIDTPGYRAKDLQALDFKRMVKNSGPRRVALKRTDADHIGSVSPAESMFPMEHRPHTFDTKPVKNDVNAEEQMMKVQQTAIEYQTTTDLYKKTVAMLRTSIGNN